jgi:membrane protein DedA with SNARE-associated domain
VRLKNCRKRLVAQFRRRHMPSLPRFSNRQHKPHHFESHPCKGEQLAVTWMDGMTEAIVELVRNHSAWAVPVVFLLAFCESFAFVSLLVPATAILFGIGGLIGYTHSDFWSLWLAASMGAIAGDWLAYAIALRFKDSVTRVWPLSRDPGLLVRGMAFFKRWGTLTIFLGRFFGPLRAVVPIVARICDMPWLSFQMANLSQRLEQFVPRTRDARIKPGEPGFSILGSTYRSMITLRCIPRS